MSATPRTDALVESIDWSFGDYAAFASVRTLALQLERELAAALAWKEEQLSVDRQWDVQAVGHLLGMTIGTPIHAHIESGIRNLILQRKLTDRAKQAMIHAYEDAMGGDRLPDGDGYDEVVVEQMFNAALDAMKGGGQ